MTPHQNTQEGWEKEFDKAVEFVGCGRVGNECGECHGVCPDIVKPFIKNLLQERERAARKKSMENVMNVLESHKINDGELETVDENDMFYKGWKNAINQVLHSVNQIIHDNE